MEEVLLQVTIAALEVVDVTFLIWRKVGGNICPVDRGAWGTTMIQTYGRETKMLASHGENKSTSST